MTDANLQEENADLRRRLEGAEEAIRAIRSGAVDAFVAAEAHGNRVYTLESADRPYRLLVEQMQQGTVTLNADGAIAYCNRRFADLLGRPHERLTGVAFRDFIPPDEQVCTRACCNKAAPAPARVKLIAEGGRWVDPGLSHL